MAVNLSGRNTGAGIILLWDQDRVHKLGCCWHLLHTIVREALMCNTIVSKGTQGGVGGIYWPPYQTSGSTTPTPLCPLHILTSTRSCKSSGNTQGYTHRRLREDPGNIQRTLRNHTGNTLGSSTQEPLREHSGNTQVTSGEDPGNTHRRLRAYPGNIQRTFSEH